MKPSLLRVTRNGLALTAALGACRGAPPPSYNPPPPEAPEEARPPAGTVAVPPGGPSGGPVLYANPPPPSVRDRINARHGLPTWESVPSPHPPGATNPPSPVLILSPGGACYKVWEGGMMPAGPDRVAEVDVNDGRTTQIDCPLPRALDVYNAWEAGKAAKP